MLLMIFFWPAFPWVLTNDTNLSLIGLVISIIFLIIYWWVIAGGIQLLLLKLFRRKVK
jgi:hypothetical protein